MLIATKLGSRAIASADRGRANSTLDVSRDSRRRDGTAAAGTARACMQIRVHKQDARPSSAPSTTSLLSASCKSASSVSCISGPRDAKGVCALSAGALPLWPRSLQTLISLSCLSLSACAALRAQLPDVTPPKRRLATLLRRAASSNSVSHTLPVSVTTHSPLTHGHVSTRAAVDRMVVQTHRHTHIANPNTVSVSAPAHIANKSRPEQRRSLSPLSALYLPSCGRASDSPRAGRGCRLAVARLCRACVTRRQATFATHARQ